MPVIQASNQVSMEQKLAVNAVFIAENQHLISQDDSNFDDMPGLESATEDDEEFDDMPGLVSDTEDEEEESV